MAYKDRLDLTFELSFFAYWPHTSCPSLRVVRHSKSIFLPVGNVFKRLFWAARDANSERPLTGRLRGGKVAAEREAVRDEVQQHEEEEEEREREREKDRERARERECWVMWPDSTCKPSPSACASTRIQQTLWPNHGTPSLCHGAEPPPSLHPPQCHPPSAFNHVMPTSSSLTGLAENISKAHV